MNRMQILQRINELSDQTCRPCSTRIAAVSTNMKEKNYGTVNHSEVCKGCSVFAELRSLGDQLLEISRSKTRLKKKEKVRMAKPKFDMTVEEFVKLRYIERMNNAEIAELKDVSGATVYKWQTKHKEAIEQARRQIKKESESKSLREENKAPEQPLLRSSKHIDDKGRVKMTASEIVAEPVIDKDKERLEADYEALSQQFDDLKKNRDGLLELMEADRQVIINFRNEKKELSQEKANLEDKLEKIERMLHESSAKELELQEELNKRGKEVIDAHRLVAEKEEELTRNDQNMDTFNDLMASKEQLHKENTRLENEVYELRGKLQSMEWQLQKKTAEAGQRLLELARLEKQLKPLKMFLAASLEQEVSGS